MSRIIFLHSSNTIVNEGEQRVLTFLDRYLVPASSNIQGKQIGDLGPEYILIPNLEIPDRSAGRYLEFDAILIAPHALYLIEVKDWGNSIDGDDQFWYLNGHREFKNPHLGLNNKCRVISSLLNKYNPEFRKIWIQCMVIIARDQTTLNLTGHCKDLTFKLDQYCLQFIKNPRLLKTPPDKRVRENSITHLQKEICEALIGKARARSNQPKIIQGYEIEEELFVDDHISEYVGFKLIQGKRSGTAKRLRVLKIPPLVSKSEQDTIRAKLLRDYEALETLGSHPNIIGLKGLIDHESDQFVEILDWSEEGTLHTVMSHRKLELKETLEIVKGIALGLNAIHNKGIIHRNLRPENILMTKSGPQIMNFDRSYLFTPQGQTVWQTITQPEELRYLPPELALPMGEYDFYQSSDLYSLGAIFYEILCGSLPFPTPLAFEHAGGKLKEEQLPTFNWEKRNMAIDSLISRLYTTDLEGRFGSAQEFLDAYELAFEAPEVIVMNLNKSVPPQSNDRIGDYQIIEQIGHSGGFSDVYRARHILQSKTYALKINRRAVDVNALIDEFGILKELNHPHIVKVDWSGQLPDGRYYLAMELLDGQSLRERLQDPDRELKTRIQEGAVVAQHILSALRYLHEPDLKTGEMQGKTLLHRDIKPENIVHVSDRGYILIDFNVANENTLESQQTFTGTRSYIAPDLIDPVRFEINWNASADTFALGCTLYEVICGQHPYNYKPQPNATPIDPKDISGCQEISEDWRQFLLKAVQLQTSERFQSALDMQFALQKVLGELPTIEVQEQKRIQQAFKESAWIRFLRQFGPVPSNDNMFDEHIQRALKRNKIESLHFKVSYLQSLIANFKEKNPKSVILTGTAGDGKTFSCREIWENLGGNKTLWDGGEKILQLDLPNGSKLLIIKDFSELDEEDNSILERMAQSILGNNFQEVFLIAANDGQLLESWKKTGESADVQKVREVIEDLLLSNTQELEGYQLHLLNLSRLVRSADEYKQIFETVLKHSGWSSCETCCYKAHKDPRQACPIWENRQRFLGENDKQILQERLISLFELSQLNGRHLTTRQLLLLLANSLLGHPEAKERLLTCKDIPKIIENRQLYLSSIYRNLFGANLSVQKREKTDVFIALNYFGLGKETNNRIDNTLIFGAETEDFAKDYEMLVTQDSYYGGHQEYEAQRRLYIEGETDDKDTFLAFLEAQRQRLFFVIPQNQEKEMMLWHLTVFHYAGEYLELYHQLQRDQAASEQIIFQMVKGLNRVITGLPTKTQHELYLSSSGCYSQAKVSSIWEGFVPVRPGDEGEMIALVLSKGSPRLFIIFKGGEEPVFEELNLQLFRFEFLMRVAHGLLPGSFSNECYEDILAFKSRLLKALRRKQDDRKLRVISSLVGILPHSIFTQPPPKSTSSITLRFIDLNEDGALKMVPVDISMPHEVLA
ncbi:hypothetical protein COW36_06940 [bacterium (Candidatus Blackallbacteria) CG17_big_fil_post_rev_8_21_14_2_50_48_46]|uniref:Non-specific serine/threonine protein kinase n=1 Tax=bacterium (Candidatus Blackallbacteria) CG17_big_fil_post_rev_8_21_14_2_50_48_46 TaxID=2014261 RepID=A0A2M7G7I5_9BACT|nr:MAG: hypothetical protein COW64_05340 [bacterium (Candidatus Blackallbacteria) CG18_big_fil_WC_8_21_14_2_50_49_26]PIW17932.1 MAG: hypothetical protein COW36_06940 [bacterium (Candidatus Blackallbacteria) CG17_big_fil_post_rev_8_21_14_2_50_48_46]PIW45751.1 MAG: hypothetical protein COW20_19120 [bacterium (Candidatus Blackallbacteria) CG13_big_fil_rev_8_21_14_2_50_49_14]